MAEMYPTQFRELNSMYRLEVGHPKEPLKLYIDIMNSDPCNWGAILGLSINCATITDLVAIGSMRNLLALDIYTSPQVAGLPRDQESGRGLGLDDRIVRSWLETTESCESLQQLRVLRFYDQDQLTTQALDMLEKLPCLELVVASYCKKLNHGLNEYFRQDKNEIRLGNWIACRLSWDAIDEPYATVTLPSRQPLLDVYRDLATAERRSTNIATNSVQSSHKGISPGEQPPKLGSGVPIMEAQLSSRYMRGWANVEGQFVVTFTRAPRARKRALSAVVTKNKDKRVMKDRGGRDVADLLGDFL